MTASGSYQSFVWLVIFIGEDGVQSLRPELRKGDDLQVVQSLFPRRLDHVVAKRQPNRGCSASYEHFIADGYHAVKAVLATLILGIRCVGCKINGHSNRPPKDALCRPARALCTLTIRTTVARVN